MRLDLEHVEPNSLAQRAALANSHDVPILDAEARRAVNGDVPVPLLIALVLLDVMEVVAAHNDGPLHFGRDDHSPY